MGLNPLGQLPPSGRIFVDTAPIIYVLENHPTLADRFLPMFTGAEARRYELVISTVTLAEVLTGPFKAGAEDKAKQYRQSLTQATGYYCVDLTPDIAQRAAEIRAHTNLKLPDAIQLATALATDCLGLVTHDRDFLATDLLPVYG